jgi:hypothetical protein
MKKISIFSVLLLAMLISSLSAKAQFSLDEFFPGGRRFYTELGGPGVVLSANYDSRFQKYERLGWGYRVGLGFGVGSFEDENYYGSVNRTYYSFPVGINYIFGKFGSASSFEVGATATVLTRKVDLYNYDVTKRGYVVGGMQFMYCWIPVNGGFTFRIGFTPMIGTAGDLFPMGAVGLGYAF